MDMEVTAWMSMYHAMHDDGDRRAFSRATLKRILGFARPHRGKLTIFLLLSVATAVLAVATPVLDSALLAVVSRPLDCPRPASSKVNESYVPSE